MKEAILVVRDYTPMASTGKIPFWRLSRQSRHAKTVWHLAKHVEGCSHIEQPRWRQAVDAVGGPDAPVKARWLRNRDDTPEASLFREYFRRFPEASHIPIDPEAEESHHSVRFVRAQREAMKSEGLSRKDAFNKAYERVGGPPKGEGDVIETIQREEERVLEESGFFEKFSS